MRTARTWITAITTLSLVFGFLVGALGEDVEVAMSIWWIAAVPLYVFTYLWIKADSRERAVPAPPGAVPLVFFFYPVSVPYHLFATRRGWNKLTAILGFVGIVVLNGILQIAGALAGAFLFNE